eukprot:12999404-Ditylum_brightwellii.AAC.1
MGYYLFTSQIQNGWQTQLLHEGCSKKRVFDLKNKGKKVPNINKSDCLYMKKYYGYFLKQNCGKTMEEMLHASNAPLEHLFDNLTLCGEWCERKEQLAEPKDG